MKISLSGRNAIVCGSTQGIGMAIAVEFAKLGAQVTLAARNETALKNVRDSLDTSGGQSHDYIAADFSRPDVLKEKVTSHILKQPFVHILVNNTGGPAAGEIHKAAADEFLDAFRNHLICNQILVQAVLEGMKKEGYGRIINIVSTSVRQPIKGLGVSNTIRAAVAGWAKTLSVELAPFGITVNNILPGATRTERLFSLFGSRAKSSGKTVEDVEQEWLKEIPAGRFAEPEELAYAAAFLASPEAAYINGVSLPVDGGRITAI